MLSSPLFWKLLLALAGLNLAAVVVLGLVYSNWQRGQIIDRTDEHLRDSAMLVRGAVTERLAADRIDRLQRYVRAVGEQTGTRFTVVEMDGTVLADSAKSTLAEVAEMESHRTRPEVLRAIAGEEGTVVRDSATRRAEYRYFALRIDAAGEAVGVVRSALPTAVVQDRIAQARRTIRTLAAVGWFGTVVLGGAVLWHLLRPVTKLTEAAEAIAAGDYEHRVYVNRRDELGQLARTLCRVCDDLHVRMAELSQTSDRQATVLGGMIEGVIAVDERERIVLANRAAGRLLGFRPAAVEGRPLLEVVRDHALHQAVTTVLLTRRPQRLETQREATDKLIADVHVNPLPGDPCPGVVLVMHDTTELRRLESLRRDFLANVSHELKTPLSSIKAYAETLRNGALDDPEASQRFLGRIEEQSERLHRLILDMLMIARIESEQQAFEIVSVDVAEVVDACLEDHAAAAGAKQIELRVERDQPPCAVRADREGLREILDNLVDNAIKYTPPGGEVAVGWRCAAGACFLRVADTGIGIGPEDRKRVFERFYRVDKARSRELGGTGLGLAIVKHLAQSFGGKVIVDSQPGQGSAFTVELPVASP